MPKETAKHSRGILLAIIASTLILGSGMSAVYAQQTALTVETDADSYQTGDTITITGRLMVTVASEPILIQILDPQGNRDRIDQVEAAADGSYRYSFTAGGLMNTNGEYTVLVTYRGQSEETTFQFTATESEWTPIDVMIGGEPHRMYYRITGSGNRLTSITGDVNTVTLLASLVANSEGTLSIRFDEETFDANNEDYAVFADEILVEYDYEQFSETEDILHIDFEAGTTEIEIIGDHIIPEFGPIAAIVLAVALVGIIAATARTGKLGSFVRKDW
ncbi:MAG TPA: PEFG-CTERM sorting domain-containing protein [Nitrososphaera sp.]|nr:PEFG-CTERM sorting domain-containing protein [Nitrososphaera sp.]